MINRSAVVIRPTGPFIEWAAGLGLAAGAPRADEDPTVYLVPPFENEAEGMAMLREAYGVLFERELAAWCDDPARWPASRDWATFRRWFQLVLLPVLVDVCEGEIREDEAEDG